MSIRTVLISRNLSSVIGKPNGKPVGRVFQIVDGDHIAEYDLMPQMADIFYWKTVELTDLQKDTIIEALTSPHYDNSEPPVETMPKKNVDLDCFSAGEITTLTSRGPIAQGLGGTLLNANFIITNA